MCLAADSRTAIRLAFAVGLAAAALLLDRAQTPPLAAADSPPAAAGEFEVLLPSFSSVSDLAVAPDGRVYVAGRTTNSSLPTTDDAVDRTCNVDGRCGSVGDAFVMILSAAGQVQYATLLGGSHTEQDTRIALTPEGNLWVAGTTLSRDFTGHEHVAACDGYAAYVTVIRPGRREIDDFRCLGGDRADWVADLTADEDSLWLLGLTASPNFPVREAWQPTLRGGSDVFLVRFARWSSDIEFATFIGGSGQDGGTALALAPDGDPIVTGSTASADFPLVRPVQSTPGGTQGDAFLLRMDRSGSHLVYSTYLGGSGPIFGCCGGQDIGHGVAVDKEGNAYVTGWTNSADFPVTHGTVDPVCGSDGRCNSPLSDAFLLGVDRYGSLRFGTYLGGSRDDEGRAVIARADGTVVALGLTQSADFPSVDPWPTLWPPQPASGVPYLTWTDNAASAYRRASLVPIATGRPFALQAVAADDAFLYLAAPVSGSSLPPGSAVVRKLRLE